MCGLLTKHPVKMVVSISSCINVSAIRDLHYRYE